MQSQIINFLKAYLKATNMDVNVLEPPYDNIASYDHGIRHKLGCDTTVNRLADVFNSTEDKTLYHITDEYGCSYSYFALDKAKGQFLFVGPYCFEDINGERIVAIMHKNNIPEVFYDYMWNYYGSIHYVVAENAFLCLFTEAANFLWGKGNFTVERPLQRLSHAIEGSDNTSVAPDQASLEILESRYKLEDEMLAAVAQGNLDGANYWLEKFMQIRFAPREEDRLRDSKNRLIILNTLLRKAAEQGGVHPLHLDRISSKYAKRLERIVRVSQEHEMYRVMVHNYCLWVRNYSYKGYSLVVKKAVSIIDYDISADLSLNTVANQLNVNPSYLSAAFKKDTGSTFTDFVNKRRIKQAHLLLNSTHMQVQNIGILCGISDLNYFTKVFKKYTGMTPSQYRNAIK